MEALNGTPVPAFEVFCEKNALYKFSTQKRYAEVVARFIDYLQEAGALTEGVSDSQLNKVIEAYPILLREGSEATALSIRMSNRDIWLAEVAERLDWSPLASKSLDNVLPGINRFLRLSESLAREVEERAAILGIKSNDLYTPLINEVTGTELLSCFEIARMKQNTMFGNVAKYAKKGIQRSRGIRAARCSNKTSKRHLDFPRESLAQLIESATSWRDKSLWLMLSATGIRTSESLNLMLSDIDFEAQMVFVFDPSGRRIPVDETHPQRARFKGRKIACTYLIPELRNDLFYALNQYLVKEYVPCYKNGEPEYLFQYIEPQYRGKPLVDASAVTLSKSFKRAVKAANITKPIGCTGWTLHSLRHMYGVYMVNDFPLNPQHGQYGLPLVDVQIMMGHTSINVTAHYARSMQRRLEGKMEAADQAILGMSKADFQTPPCFNIN